MKLKGRFVTKKGSVFLYHIMNRKENNFINILNTRAYENPILIGNGAFGKVYRVTHRETMCQYACKVIEKGKQSFLHNEVENMQQLFHPLFAKFHETWENNSRIYVIMEFVWGSNLDLLLKRRGRLTQETVKGIALELSSGLEYLQRQGKIYGDLKAENIIIMPSGRVKLLDYGSIMTIQKGKKVVTGTRGYLRRETLEKKVMTYQDDVYALGKLMQYMIWGVNPISQDVFPGEVCHGHSYCSMEMEEIIFRCVTKDNQKRIPDISILKMLLEHTKHYPGISFLKNILESF